MPIESNAITLDHSVEIYVPTESRYGELLPEDLRAEVLEQVKSSLYDWFGGVTRKKNLRVEQVEGSWPLASGEMADERVDVVYANASREALEEHFEDLPVLAAEVANRLMQEFVAFRVDSKMKLIKGDESKSPRGYKSPRVKDRMRALQAALQRISSVRDARDLFCNVLHYEFEDEQLAMVKWPDQLKACLAAAPRIIADQNGFKILYLQLAEDYLRKGHERQLVQRIIKDDPTLRGLVVVSDAAQKDWHLVNADIAREEGKRDRLLLRRMRVGSGQSVRTAVERLSSVDIELVGENIKAYELQQLHNEAFDVESVSKEFFNEISNWYFWALSEVKFPTDTLKDGDDDEKHRATSLIRFLTRIIFCWFLKEKRLIPESLFREKFLADILKNLDDDSCTYHQGILQNLFFATLNQRMGKDSEGQPYRAFAKDEGFPKNKSTYGVDTLYRYEGHFQDADKALSHFADVPFLNGGLFECLDRTDEDTGKKLYVDGFSRNKKKRPHVPNRLFFAGEQTVDLSAAYGDNARRNARVRGLLNILHAYNFTVEENTPIDEEIALDPELLGKVFENLLASYNEETKTTARKQTGSFYTPRPIVEYMVDESLKVHLCGALTTLGRKEEEAREQLDLLLGYTDEEPSFSEKEINALLEAIHTCKILDPACGSGAFPIGMLQKLVHIVHKLDPENARWKQLQIDQASKILDSSARDAAIKAIERDFEENGDDYGRKLYLIENCLYGVDIQPIAIQISKLRFFISLICDQKTNRNKAKNHGIRALPNLETKFVAADTLIGLPEIDQMALLDPRVNQIEAEIESLYHRHFSIQRRDQKLKLQDRLKEHRKELGRVLAESLGSSQKAQHLADWDPFDSQSSADFFDPHWMFGQSLSEGFDLVIGNPPYVQIQKFSAAQKALWEAQEFKVYGATADIYCLFYERGLQLLKQRGHLCYITSNKWMRAGYGKKTRVLLSSSRTLLQIIDFGELPVFVAATDTAIVLARNALPGNVHGVGTIMMKDAEEIANLSADVPKRIEIRQQDTLKSDGWVLESAAILGLLKKLRQAGKPLEEVVDGRFYRGILTGLNKAFIVDRKTRDKLIKEHPSSFEVLKPFAHGADAKKWNVELRDDWLVYVPWHFPLHLDKSISGASKQAEELFKRRYPAVYNHLLYYKTDLLKRNAVETGIRYEWYALQRWGAEYWQEFEQPRVIFNETSKELHAFLDDSGLYTNKTLFMLVAPHPKPLLAVLLSRLLDWLYRHEFPSWGDPWKGGRVQFRRDRMATIPIPEIPSKVAEKLSNLVDRVGSAKCEGTATDTATLEGEIDQIVYTLYGLTKEEVEMVETSMRKK